MAPQGGAGAATAAASGVAAGDIREIFEIGEKSVVIETEVEWVN